MPGPSMPKSSSTSSTPRIRSGATTPTRPSTSRCRRATPDPWALIGHLPASRSGVQEEVRAHAELGLSSRLTRRRAPSRALTSAATSCSSSTCTSTRSARTTTRSDRPRDRAAALLDARSSGVPIVTWGKKVTGVLLNWLEGKTSIDLLPTLINVANEAGIFDDETVTEMKRAISRHPGLSCCGSWSARASRPSAQPPPPLPRATEPPSLAAVLVSEIIRRSPPSSAAWTTRATRSRGAWQDSPISVCAHETAYQRAQTPRWPTTPPSRPPSSSRRALTRRASRRSPTTCRSSRSAARTTRRSSS